ncbi:integrase core domain-containing protein [Prodigiosinella confusarubida]
MQALNLGVNALSEVRYLTKNWRMEYNEERPHSSLGNLPSVIYA